MSLTWAPRSGHPSGCHLPGFEAEVRRKGETTSVLVIPTAGRWIALGPVGIIEAPTPAGWPSEDAARAAVEEAVTAFLAPKKRGRPPGRTIRFSRYLPAQLVEAARAEALRRDPTGLVITDGDVFTEWAERGRVMP